VLLRDRGDDVVEAVIALSDVVRVEPRALDHHRVGAAQEVQVLRVLVDLPEGLQHECGVLETQLPGEVGVDHAVRTDRVVYQRERRPAGVVDLLGVPLQGGKHLLEHPQPRLELIGPARDDLIGQVALVEVVVAVPGRRVRVGARCGVVVHDPRVAPVADLLPAGHRAIEGEGESALPGRVLECGLRRGHRVGSVARGDCGHVEPKAGAGPRKRGGSHAPRGCGVEALDGDAYLLQIAGHPLVRLVGNRVDRRRLPQAGLPVAGRQHGRGAVDEPHEDALEAAGEGLLRGEALPDPEETSLVAGFRVRHGAVVGVGGVVVACLTGEVRQPGDTGALGRGVVMAEELHAQGLCQAGPAPLNHEHIARAAEEGEQPGCGRAGLGLGHEPPVPGAAGAPVSGVGQVRRTEDQLPHGLGAGEVIGQVERLGARGRDGPVGGGDLAAEAHGVDRVEIDDLLPVAEVASVPHVVLADAEGQW